MKRALRLATCCALLLATATRAEAAFVQAYTVAAPSSTVPVDEFAQGGPVPWLFVELPGLGSFFEVTSSDWFAPGATSPTLEDVFPSVQDGTRFWMAPAASAWGASEVPGQWRIQASYELVGILFAENGGIGVGISEGAGSASIRFTVVPPPAPVPLPPSAALLLAGLAWLAARARRGSPR